MSRFAEFDPAAWVEDDVLVIRTLARAQKIATARRPPSNWRSSVMLTAFGLTLATGLHLAGLASGADESIVIAREQVAVWGDRAPPDADVVPPNYWRNLAQVAARLPAVADQAANDDDYEPFI